MTPEQYRSFVARASDELDRKQDALFLDRGIGTFDDFLFDQTTGKIYFKDEKGRTQLEADVTPLGTYSTETETWLWAWANESFLPELREKAARLKKLSEKTGKPHFAQRRIKATEIRAWRLAGISVKHLRSQGCYRIPTDDLYVFLALDNIVKVGKRKRKT
jgi:hypothetical protein